MRIIPFPGSFGSHESASTGGFAGDITPVEEKQRIIKNIIIIHQFEIDRK